jgi:hypothetical protein
MTRHRKKKNSHQILGMIDPRRAERLLTYLANVDPSTWGPEPEYTGESLQAMSSGLEHPKIVKKLLSDYPEVFEPINRADPENLPWRIGKLTTCLRRIWDAVDSRHRDWHLFELRREYHGATIRTGASKRLDEAGKHAYGLKGILMNLQRQEEWLRGAIKGDKTNTLVGHLKDDTYIWTHQLSAFEEQIAGLKEEIAVENRRESVPPDITPMEAALYHLQRIGDRARHCPNPECPAPYFIAMKKGQKYCSPDCAEPSRRESKRKWWNVNRGKEGGG